MMTLMEAMEARHSVRSYMDKPLADDVYEDLTVFIADCNEESGLHIQLITDEPQAFDSKMAHYGHFSGVSNYIALIGKRGRKLQEKCGYYGEKIVLHAQQLGLNTCWVAMTYKRIPDVFDVGPKEKLVVIIAIGYGLNAGTSHKSRQASMIAPDYSVGPDWYRRGINAVLLAPSAVNQQKFRFGMQGSRVYGKPGVSFCSKIDFGIAKYHFELGSGKDSKIWA